MGLKTFDRCSGLPGLRDGTPRRAWSAFSVSAKTVRRGHRRLVARRWTYERHGLGRPSLDGELQELIMRLAREKPLIERTARYPRDGALAAPHVSRRSPPGGS